MTEAGKGWWEMSQAIAIQGRENKIMGVGGESGLLSSI